MDIDNCRPRECEFTFPRAGRGLAPRGFRFRESVRGTARATEFVKIARTFHTPLSEDIPVMSSRHRRNEAKRLILADRYASTDNGVKLNRLRRRRSPIGTLSRHRSFETF